MSRYSDCGKQIKEINDVLERRANNELRTKGLTLAQLRVLMLLNDTEKKTCPLKKIERFLCVAQSTAAGIVSRLEQKHFIESFGDPEDKRIKMVKITPEGEQCCLDARENMQETEAYMLAPLTEEERVTFRRLLKEVRDSME